MARKLPKKLTRPIPETRFRKKFLKRIYLEGDREFVESAFTDTKEGAVLLREDLSPKDKERVAAIYTDIRKNRGLLRTGRLAVIAIIIGGAILFSLVFKDRLLENAAERLLEATFQARSEIDGLRFRLFEGSIRIDAVTVADRDRPMRNLFQLGETELDIKTAELLKGNVIISRLAATGTAFGTPREESGALTTAPTTERSDSPAGDGAAIARAGSAGIAVLEELGLSGGTLDPQQILNEAVGDLESLRLAGELTREAEQTQDTIAAIVDRMTERVDRIEERATTLAERELPRITDVEGARSLYVEVNGEVDAAEQIYRETIGDADLIQSEVARLRGLERALRDAITADIATIGDRIPDLSIEPREFALGLVRTFLAEFLGTTYDRGTMVLERFEQLQRLRDEREPGTRGPRRGGVDIAFPTVRYPRFAITEATADAGEDLAITITGISSDPDLTDTPIVLTYRQGGSAPVILDATVDFRTARAELARYRLELPTVTTVLPPRAVSIGFATLDGAGSLEMTGTLGGAGTDEEADARGDARATLDGSLRYSLQDPVLTPTATAGGTATILAETVNGTNQVEAQVAFRIEEGELTRFSGSTSLVDALRARIDALIASVRTAAEARLRTELESRLGGSLGAYEEYLGTIASLSDRSIEELARGETYTALAEEQRQEIEARLTEFTGELEDQVRAEADARAAEAAAEVDARAAELEAEAAAARAEAERQAAEAEAAAQAAAEEEARVRQEQLEQEARERLPIPRFGN